jgi:hypothetical protein
MEAKETVLKSSLIPPDNGIHFPTLEEQAEISFKAGIKEVVDWVDSFIPSQYRKEELWQARVKEWLGENK